VSITSYAQNFEDVLLWRALGHVERGRYLDIGAQDPVQDSVSLAFYERGWRGIHVEPTPSYAARLREARPDEIVIEAAVSAHHGPIEFHEFPDTGLSTGKLSIAEKHNAQGFAGRKILVPTVRLDGLLERTGELHWLKIDVEGMEADVLASWGDHPARPWILVIEATVPLQQDKTDEAWRHEVLARDYVDVQFDGLSHFFVSRKRLQLLPSFEMPANVFDSFQVTPRHFCAQQLRSQSDELGAQVERLSSEKAVVEAQTADLTMRLAHIHSELETSERNRTAALEAAYAAEGAHARSLQAVVDAEREHRLSLDRLGRERRDLELELRHYVERSSSDLLAKTEEIATLCERTTNLINQVQQLTQQATDARQRLSEVEQGRSQQMAALQAELEQRAGELSVVQKHLNEATGLVRLALAQPVDRWQRVGRALGISREDRARRTLRSSLSVDLQFDPKPREVSMSLASSGEALNPYLRANSLAELLSWHDVSFVCCAYVTILGRQPDPEGETYYTRRIRQGHSKLEVVRQLRRSGEGAQHDPGIAGLDRALKRARWEQGMLGWLFRPITRGEGDGSAWRRHRIILNEIGRMQANDSGFGGAELRNALRSLQQEISRLGIDLTLNSAELPASLGKSSAHNEELSKLLASPAYKKLGFSTQRVFRKLVAA
jgi:FkbM family methyltransferase